MASEHAIKAIEICPQSHPITGSFNACKVLPHVNHARLSCAMKLASATVRYSTSKSKKICRAPLFPNLPNQGTFMGRIQTDLGAAIPRLIG